MRCEKRLNIVPGAGHLFEEPGALEAVIERGRGLVRALSEAPTPAEQGGCRPAARPPTPLRAAAKRPKPLPPIDDPGFRRRLRPLRRCPRRAARRGVARQLGVLPCPRGDHPPADRAPRLSDRRGGGGLAGRRRGRPLCAAQAAPADERDAVHALPGLDVAQHAMSTTSWPGCGATTRACQPAHRAGFYGLDLYNMSASMAAVLAYLDRVDPAAAASGAAAIRLPDAVEPRARRLRQGLADRGLCTV